MSDMTGINLADLIRQGSVDEFLGRIQEAVEERLASQQQWQPIENLLEILRTVDKYATEGVVRRAEMGAELNTQLKEYNNHRSVVVRKLADGVRLDMYVRLLGLRDAERAEHVLGLAELSELSTTERNST